MKPKIELEENPESSDSSDETEESSENALSNVQAFLKNPNAVDTFLKMAKEEPEDLLNGAHLIEEEPWASKALCLAATNKPELALTVSPSILDPSLRAKVVKSARKALKNSLQ